jgi:hypothetical protein
MYPHRRRYEHPAQVASWVKGRAAVHRREDVCSTALLVEPVVVMRLLQPRTARAEAVQL